MGRLLGQADPKPGQGVSTEHLGSKSEAVCAVMNSLAFSCMRSLRGGLNRQKQAELAMKSVEVPIVKPENYHTDILIAEGSYLFRQHALSSSLHKHCLAFPSISATTFKYYWCSRGFVSAQEFSTFVRFELQVPATYIMPIIQYAISLQRGVHGIEICLTDDNFDKDQSLASQLFPLGAYIAVPLFSTQFAATG